MALAPPSTPRSGGSLSSKKSSGLGSFHREVGLANPPAFIQVGNMRFLIMDAPTDQSLPLYIREFEKYNVTDVVRLCNPTYSKDRLESQGIRVHEMSFPDGDPPPSSILQAFSALSLKTFGPPHLSSSDSSPATPAMDSSTDAIPATLAVHCVAGLGRAPVLVAAQLVESGMDALSAVELIRKNRRGAINMKQLEFLEKHAKAVKNKCIIQ